MLVSFSLRVVGATSKYQVSNPLFTWVNSLTTALIPTQRVPEETTDLWQWCYVNGWQTQSQSSGGFLKIDYFLGFHCIFVIAICPFAEISTKYNIFAFINVCCFSPIHITSTLIRASVEMSRASCSCIILMQNIFVKLLNILKTSRKKPKTQGKNSKPKDKTQGFGKTINTVCIA